MQVSQRDSWRCQDVTGSGVQVPILVRRADSSQSPPPFAALESLCFFLEKRRTKSSCGVGGSFSMGSKGHWCAAPVLCCFPGAPLALWWQSPRNGVRADRGHPVPVLEIPAVKGGWAVWVQYFPLALVVVWHVLLCVRVCSQVFFPCVPVCVHTCGCAHATSLSVHRHARSCAEFSGGEEWRFGVLGGKSSSCWRGCPWAVAGVSSVQCPEGCPEFSCGASQQDAGASSSLVGLCPT